MTSRMSECTLPLPRDMVCARCLARLESEVAGLNGVQHAAVDKRRDAILVTYAETELTLSSLTAAANQIGEGIASGIDHQVIALEDLHCPDCAVNIQKQTGRLPGVLWSEVNFLSAQVTVEYEKEKIGLADVCEAIERHGVRARPSSASGPVETGTVAHKNNPVPGFRPSRREVETVVTIALTVLALLALGLPVPGVSACLCLAAIVIGGRNLAYNAWQSLRLHSIDMNVLVILAATGAVGCRDWIEGATVIALFNLGNLLQSRAMERTRHSLTGLMELTPRMARVRRNSEEVIPVEHVRLHEIVLVKPGERIAIDGTVVVGTSTVNQAPITGESRMIVKSPGDTVYSGTLNGAGALEIQATHLFRDTTLARIIHWVEEARSQRARSQQFIDRFARIYTPIVVMLAIAIAVLPPSFQASAHLILHAPFQPASMSLWFSRALAVLLISCPCALVISTPVAIVTAIGAAARNGVLVKGGASLEAAATLKAMLYDKTGTLTTGHCRIDKVVPLAAVPVREILRLAAALEAKSEHPISSAFAWEEDYPARPEVSDFHCVPGEGICGTIDGLQYLFGSARLLQDNEVPLTEVSALLGSAEASEKTALLLVRSQEPIGIIIIGDTPRADARNMVRELQSLGILRQAMLTGDNEQVAAATAEGAGITEVYAQLLPEHKVGYVKRFQESTGPVGMVGDGINDAPALAAADLGIVMGVAGSDTAMETADIALMSDDLSRLPFTIRLSRKTRTIIRQNVAFSLVTKGLLLVTAVAAGVPLWLAVLGDVGVTLVVTLNALRLAAGDQVTTEEGGRSDRPQASAAGL